MNKNKIPATLSMLSVLAYVSIVVILGRLSPGYNHMRDLVSELGKNEAPYNYLLNSVLLFSGVSLVLLAFALFHVISKSPQLRYGCLSLGLFGFSVILGGLFPCDSNCMEPTSMSGYLHAITGMPALVTAPLAFVLLGKAAYETLPFAGVSNLIFWLGIGLIPFMVLSITLFPHYNLVGLGQRIAAFFQLAVPFILAFQLFNYKPNT